MLNFPTAVRVHSASFQLQYTNQWTTDFFPLKSWASCGSVSLSTTHSKCSLYRGVPSPAVTHDVRREVASAFRNFQTRSQTIMEPLNGTHACAHDLFPASCGSASDATWSIHRNARFDIAANISSSYSDVGNWTQPGKLPLVYEQRYNISFGGEISPDTCRCS